MLIKEQLIFHISEGASHFAQRTHRALILDVLVVLLVNIKGDERPAVALETGLLVNWALPASHNFSRDAVQKGIYPWRM